MIHVSLILAGLIFSVISAIKPFYLKRININIISGPIIVIFLLLVFRILDFEIIANAFKGYDSLKPWEILIIFYSVAFVSISVDLSGVLDYFAFKIIARSNGNGYLLFFFFYSFASVLTIFTSNDIVILTLTPIIFYLKKHANINIIPLLFAEFFGANTLSMLLYIGNPTNIIFGNAMNLSFIEYSKVMFFPTMLATFLNLFALFLFFRKKISKKFILKSNSTYKLRNLYDAIISSLLLFIMLIMLLLSERINLNIWQITLFFAVLFIIEDLLIGLFYTVKNYKLYITELSTDLKKVFAIYGFEGNRHDFFVIFKRLPWKILPFICTVFILIYSLVHYGFIDILCSFLSGFYENTLLNILFYGFSGFFIANLINNQPMSILFSNILLNPNLLMPASVQNSVVYALIIASNLGANLTLTGALAGLMWENILRKKNLRINYRIFFKVGLIITPLVFLASLLTLWLILR